MTHEQKAEINIQEYIDDRNPTSNIHSSGIKDSTSLPPKKPNVKKQRITVQISTDIIERAKNAVYWTPGLTLASLVECAIAEAIEKLEKERKNPFPHRKEELKTGRPIH